MAAKLKKGDKVIVLTGRDKGKEGEIASINPKAGKAVVDGINVAIRHISASSTNSCHVKEVGSAVRWRASLRSSWIAVFTEKISRISSWPFFTSSTSLFFATLPDRS